MDGAEVGPSGHDGEPRKNHADPGGGSEGGSGEKGGGGEPHQPPVRLVDEDVAGPDGNGQEDQEEWHQQPDHRHLRWDQRSSRAGGDSSCASSVGTADADVARCKDATMSAAYAMAKSRAISAYSGLQIETAIAISPLGRADRTPASSCVGAGPSACHTCRPSGERCRDGVPRGSDA